MLSNQPTKRNRLLIVIRYCLTTSFGQLIASGCRQLSSTANGLCEGALGLTVVNDNERDSLTGGDGTDDFYNDAADLLIDYLPLQGDRKTL